MDSNEDPFRIPTEVLAAIGEVAVNAATLETVMVGVVLRIHPNADTEIIKSTPRISGALKQACADLKQADPTLGERAEKWHQQAENLLLNRHAVVHSVLVHDDATSPATIAHWHPRSDLFQAFNLDMAKRLADNTSRCSAAGLHLAEFIVGIFPKGVPR